MGNLSFHSQHKNGAYTDHAGSNFVADDHTEVTIHHATGSSSPAEISMSTAPRSTAWTQ